MKSLFLCCSLMMWLGSSSLGSGLDAPPRGYLLTWTSIELDGELGRIPQREDISEWVGELKDAGRIRVQEEMTSTSVEGIQGMVQFGKRVPVTVGETIAGPQRTRVQQQEVKEFGTLAEFLVQSTEQGMLVTFTYESSTLSNEESAGPMPGIEMIQASSTVMVQPGVPVVIGSLSSSRSRIVLMAVIPVK